ncbi:MAG: hypothetical protein AAF990_03235 [Bacteroidota bacterium]
MKNLVLTFSLFSLFTVFATAQSEIGLTHHRSLFLHDASSLLDYETFVSSASYGAYYANRVGKRLQLRTSLNYTINRKEGYFHDFSSFPPGVGFCGTLSPNSQSYKQLELGVAARYMFFNFWKLGVYGEIGLLASTQLNDQRQTLYYARENKEVLSHAANTTLGIRFRLSERMFADLEMQRRRYWQHDYLSSMEKPWLYIPGIAIAYQIAE